MAVGSIISPFALALGEQSPMKGRRKEMKADIEQAQTEYDAAIDAATGFDIQDPYASGIGIVQAQGDVTGTLGIDTVSDRILQDQQAQTTAQTLAALRQQGPGASAAGLAQLLATQGEKQSQQRAASISKQFRENQLTALRGRETAAARALSASQSNVQRDLSIAAGTANIQQQQLDKLIGETELAAADLAGAESALAADDAQIQAIAGGVGTALGAAIGGPAGAAIGGAIGSGAGALLT
tara:strand:+ start:1718 stop:2437 length:720 start_codon:yes stop_codon:yes gene_type:complete